MRKLLLLLCLALPSVLVAADSAALLHSIAIVEDWRGRVGKAGEIGPYQMLPSTRADRIRDLAARGIVAPTEQQIAQEHVDWLRRELRKAGTEPLPFNLALCWNAGLNATVTGRAPERSYRYACRVVGNLETTHGL
jgi:hypothetical protein